VLLVGSHPLSNPKYNGRFRDVPEGYVEFKNFCKEHEAYIYVEPLVRHDLLKYTNYFNYGSTFIYYLFQFNE